MAPSILLVLDDIMDGAHSRRGQPCWFRVEKVGVIAAYDGVLLRNHIPRTLKKHFRERPYDVDLLDLFDEVEFQTASGQMIDLITTIEGEKDLSKYSLSLHRRIVQFKTAYNSFYLPLNFLRSEFRQVDAPLILRNHISGGIEINYTSSLSIFSCQVACALLLTQDDYLDRFGETEKIGKECLIATDIEDFKCSWLVVKALDLCNVEQKSLLHEHFGKNNPADVAIVKSLYNDISLQSAFAEYESKSYEKIVTSIEAHLSKEVQAVLKSFLVCTLDTGAKNEYNAISLVR